MRRSLVLSASVCMLLLVGGCGGDDEETPTTVSATLIEEPPATTEEAAPTTDEAESSRCEDVPQDLVDGIATGLNGPGGNTLSNAQAVKSKDFEEVYFISADIDGPGIGTGAKSGPLAVGEGLILAVDNYPKEFSHWGDGGKTDAELSKRKPSGPGMIRRRCSGPTRTITPGRNSNASSPASIGAEPATGI